MKHNKNIGSNVPNLRFPEFEGEWSECTIASLCSEFKSGKNIKAEDIKDCDTYPVYGGNGLRGYTSTYNHDGDYILIGRQGALCGNIRFVTNKSYVTEHAIAVAANSDNSTICLKYLLLRMNLGQYSDQSAQPGLAVNKLLKLKVFTTSIIEQQKIATLLSLIDERISTQNKIIEDLKLLKSAIRDKLYSTLSASKCTSLEFKDVLDYEQPAIYIVSKDEYCSNSSLTPVLTANKAFILGYTKENHGIYDKGQCIIFDDFTMDSKFVDFPFKVKSSAIKILRAKDGFDTYFIFEYIAYLRLSSEEHKRHYISEIETRCLDIPDYGTQLKIASILQCIDNEHCNCNKIKELNELEKHYLLHNLFT